MTPIIAIAIIAILTILAVALTSLKNYLSERKDKKRVEEIYKSAPGMTVIERKIMAKLKEKRFDIHGNNYSMHDIDRVAIHMQAATHARVRGMTEAAQQSAKSAIGASAPYIDMNMMVNFAKIYVPTKQDKNGQTRSN